MRLSSIRTWVLYLALCGVSAAQTVTGNIDGQITDQGGAVIPNAYVMAKNVATSFRCT